MITQSREEQLIFLLNILNFQKSRLSSPLTSQTSIVTAETYPYTCEQVTTIE